MSELDEALSRLHRHDGVRHTLLLGRDGLLVRHLGADPDVDAETAAAMIPALATACATIGRSTGLGDFATGVIELSAGVTIVLALPGDLLLALVLDGSVGFAPLLRDARRERDALAALL